MHRAVATSCSGCRRFYPHTPARRSQILMHGLGARLRSCHLRHLQSQNLRFSCRKNASVVTSDMTASAMRSVRKRNVVVLNGRFRPKRSKNGLHQSHTARTGAGNSTSVAPWHPGSLFRPSAHLLAKPHMSPFCLIWGLSLGVSLFAHRARVRHGAVRARRRGDDASTSCPPSS